MKKVVIVLLVCFLTICGCANKDDSNHSESDINNAKMLVEDYFNEYFDDCTLIDIWYEEDALDAEQEYKEENDYQEIIILKMKFKTGENQLVFNDNSEYVYDAMVGKKDNKWAIVEGMVGQG